MKRWLELTVWVNLVSNSATAIVRKNKCQFSHCLFRIPKIKVRVPTIINSMGINTLIKWYNRHSAAVDIFAAQDLGDKMIVSHAAIVNVHTKRNLCADRWGGRVKEGGSWKADMVGALAELSPHYRPHACAYHGLQYAGRYSNRYKLAQPL